MGRWVSNRLLASLISFPHTAISLNPAESPMVWEAALAIPKRMSCASCSCLKHPLYHEGKLWRRRHGQVSAPAWIHAVLEKQVHQQHTARRDHEWFFIPSGGKTDSKQGEFVFAGSQGCAWLPTYAFSLCWDLTGSTWHEGQLSWGLQGQRSPSRQKITVTTNSCEPQRGAETKPDGKWEKAQVVILDNMN